jgi:hypothetical protein
MPQSWSGKFWVLSGKNNDTACGANGVGFWKRLCKRGGNKRATTTKPVSSKAVQLIYGWASPQIPAHQNSPYVYVFRVSPIADTRIAYRSAQKSESLRRFIRKHLDLQDSSVDEFERGKEFGRLWNAIIPSDSRPATHRIELGILRKGSGIGRSAFFVEYFCFAPITVDGRDADTAAIRIAGFLASQLKDSRVFDGGALTSSKAHWLFAIQAAWARL